VSRFRQALAATAMAAAAAGGGLLIAAAGAVPASAATQVSPTGGHSGGHVVATFTFRPAAQAASGPGTSVIHPCVRPGAAPAYGDGGGCDGGIVTCTVTAHNPTDLYSLHGEEIDFTADTWCSEDVPEIRMGQDVIHSTPIDPNNPLTKSTVVNDTDHADTSNSALCQPGQYAVNASARIIPPAGDILSGTLQDTSATITFTCASGGGGGGGCGIAAPSVSGQPAGRHPDLITCGG
jgi:hypothetical protein